MNLPKDMEWNSEDNGWLGAIWTYVIDHEDELVLVDHWGDELTIATENDAKKEAIIWAIEAPEEMETLRAIAKEARAISSLAVGQGVLSDWDFRQLRELLDRLELKE